MAEHDPFLTLSQATLLYTRHALPAIDDLLDALGHAASLPALPEQKRRVLADAERGIRAVCRPAVQEIAPGESCWRCPTGADDLAAMNLPHTGNGHQTYAYLLRAGYTDCAAIAVTPDAVLKRAFGISKARLGEIRRAVPYAGDEGVNSGAPNRMPRYCPGCGRDLVDLPVGHTFSWNDGPNAICFNVPPEQP